MTGFNKLFANQILFLIVRMKARYRFQAISACTVLYLLLLLYSVQAQVTQSPSPEPIQVNSIAKVGKTVSGTVASEIFRNLVALSNLIFVVWFFYASTRMRKSEREEDILERKAKLKLETGNFWIQKLIIEPNIQWVHEFFNQYEDEIEIQEPFAAETKMEEVRILIRAFRSELRTLRRRISEPLAWVDPRFSSLDPIIGSIEDLVTTHLQTRTGVIPDEPKTSSPIEQYQSLRKSFFSEIYEMQKRFSDL